MVVSSGNLVSFPKVLGHKCPSQKSLNLHMLEPLPFSPFMYSIPFRLPFFGSHKDDAERRAAPDTFSVMLVSLCALVMEKPYGLSQVAPGKYAVTVPHGW